jgi:hypothetical protein
MPDAQDQLDQAGGLSVALFDALDQLVDKVLGKQTVDKDGKPLRQVAYMHMPNGLPIDPRQYANPWTPAGGATLQGMLDDGTLAAPAPAPAAASANGDPAAPSTTPAPPAQDPKLMAAMQSALNTAWLFDEMVMVTGDGTYRPYPSTRKLSSAYEGLIHSLQAVPPPPRPPEVAEELAKAQKVLYKLDAEGNILGPSNKFQNHLKFSQAYADAKAEFARQHAAAMADPILGAAWPATGAAAQQKVDNAYDIWRSSGAGDVEDALDTLNSEGGSAAAFFAAQSRELFDKWDLSLAGVVAAKTPYTQITPASWYDHTNDDIGFAGLTIESSKVHREGGTKTSSFANRWYKGQSESTQAGGFGSIMGITVGGGGGGSSSESSSAGHQGGTTSSEHADKTTSARIELEWGVVNIQRPWLLTELFHIGGWYVPGEPAGCVSDGTIAGQEGDDKKLLPMITTQALVIRNVKIVATGMGSAGKALEEHFANQQANAESSSWNAAGSVGFLCFGGAAKHEESEWAGASSEDSGASWGFSYNAFKDEGTLTINGCQIVGYVGEIVGMNPRLAGGTPSGGALPSNGKAETPATPAVPAGGNG